MFKWAAVLLVFVVVSAVLGFAVLTGLLAEVMKFVFFVFMILFVGAVLTGLVHQPIEEPTITSSNQR